MSLPEIDLGLAGLLDWVADRLVHVHGEDPNVDYVLALRRYSKEWRSSALPSSRSLESIAKSLEKIASPLKMTDAAGVLYTLEGSLQFAGYKIVRDDSRGPNAMWLSGQGLRESGPA